MMTTRHAAATPKRIALSGLFLMACACASVTVDLPSEAGEATPGAAQPRVREHEALAGATRALGAHLPPAPTTSEALGRLVFGGHAAAKEAATRRYLSGLGEDPLAAVLADADQGLVKARAVAEAGRLAAEAMTPNRNDVDLLEAAIGDLRRARALYADALGLLAQTGAPIARSDIREVKDAYRQTASDIGVAADRVAARLTEDVPAQVAGPPGAGDL